jgi:hypothetical protein
MPQHRSASIDDRLLEVAEGFVFVPEAMPAVMHGDEAFLHHFFRRRLVPDEQGCQADQRTIVAGVQLRDRLAGRQLSPN